MLQAMRQSEIVQILQQKKSVSVSELSQYFNTSTETIRRDLLKMEQEGKVARVHGGAYLHNIVRQEVPTLIRKVAKQEEKESIASLCIEQIKSGDTIFLDSSTTALYIAKRLSDFTNLTVITNYLEIIHLLSTQTAVNILALGGALDRQFMSFMDVSTLRELEGYHVDIGFVSCTGVDLKTGLTDSNVMEGQIRRLMLTNATKRICIADHTKLNKTTLTRIVPLSDIDMIVCDKPFDVRWKSALDSLNIQAIF